MRTFMTSPLGWVFLAGLMSLVWPRIKPHRRRERPGPAFNPFSLLAWGLLTAFSSPLGGTWLDNAVIGLGQRWPPLPPISGEDPQVVLVFTGGVQGDTEAAPLNGASLERLLAAGEAARRWPAAAILFSGGPKAGEVRGAAEKMAALAGNLGVDPGRVVVEKTAQTTRDNALQCSRILREKGWSRVVLVTSPGHMARARAALLKTGINSRPFSPDPPARSGFGPGDLIPSVEALAASDAALHEMIGILVYRILGWA